ncbi:hypothetical protein GH714_002366 [Hevea brasiliensis]|uniref:Protein kinase domain-containing protein n=1 Tax=Hevea brasiliensis TaxID=3981 RepID=A0A6A6LB64_HEVBR|nr:hypothetical protein GH714_002366 [Hevea brasiliensis]
MASFPLAIQPERNSGLKSRPGMPSSYQKSVSFSNQNSSLTNNFQNQIERNPLTNKQRSLSPLPETVLSDTFKEARSDRKRFSTPHPRWKDQEKKIMGKFLHKEFPETEPSSPSSNTGPLQHLALMEGHEKSKVKKDSGWTKYFDHGGGRVNAVEAADEFVWICLNFFSGLDLLMGHIASFTMFVAACKKPPVYCVITEYLSEGSLRAYLHKLEHKSLTLQRLIAVALDIARGMEYIHSQGVIHRDLKPENVLIDQEFHLKIADFGIACEEAYCDSLADDPGTYRWMAPEMIKKKSYGRRVDVYSFGLILWEMVAGTIPYEDMNPIQAAFAVVNKNLRPVIPRDCPPAMRALIEQCWCLHPEKRPEFWQIVKVLEQFESSLACDGTLNLVQNPTCQDHKKGLLHWIQKLGPVHPSSSPIPKPKFT